MAKLPMRRVTVTIFREQDDLLRRLAAECDASASFFVRRALEHYQQTGRLEQDVRTVKRKGAPCV